MKILKMIPGTLVLAVAFISCSKEKTPAPPPVVTPTDKVIAVFKFDGNPSDSAGKAMLSGVVGTPTYVNDRNGNANGAVYLNGGVKFEYPNVSFKGKSLTMAAWVKAQTAAGLRHFAVALHPGTGGPTLFKVGNKLGGTVSVTGTSSAESNDVNDQWHHLAMTYDGTDIKVYVDGVLSATANHPGTMGDGARNLVIGAFGTEYFTGILDDLRIYNTVFSAGEISKLVAL